MIYLICAAALIFITSIRGISFAIWQAKNRNFLGAAAVAAISLIPAILIVSEI